jgi:hypothetical protein
MEPEQAGSNAGGNCHKPARRRKEKRPLADNRRPPDKSRMTKATDDRKTPAGRGNPGRGERLAAALRENLKRRKAQERARAQDRDAPASAPPPDKDR